MPMECPSSVTIRRVPGGISSVRATMCRLSTSVLLRSGQPVQCPSRLVHHILSQAGRKVARREIRSIAIPMREITREQQHAIRGKHLQHPVKVFGAIGLFDGLGSEVDVLEDNLTRRSVE